MHEAGAVRMCKVINSCETFCVLLGIEFYSEYLIAHDPLKVIGTGDVRQCYLILGHQPLDYRHDEVAVTARRFEPGLSA